MNLLLKLIALVVTALVSSWRGRKALEEKGALEEENTQLKADAEIQNKISESLNDNIDNGAQSILDKLRGKTKDNN